MKLFLKGDRCFGAKCGVTRRPTPPGQHGQSRRRKPSGYALQLREKQKVRRTYGVLEKQFALYFAKAEQMKGVVGENLLRLLELRLDNIVFRLGFASSRAQARQFVTHGHFRVNGKKVDIPSYQVSAGDVIAVKETSRDVNRFKEAREGADRPLPKWLEFNADALEGRVVALPQRDDIDLSVEEHMIVELYSR